MSCPVCSIIIPAYNSEKTIGRCLESLQLQAPFITEIEILVIDDGSNDQTASIAKKLLHGISNAKVISQANGGVSKARNTGISAATGKYVCFLDSDDTMDRQTLEDFFCVALANDYDYLIADFVAVNESENLKSPMSCNLSHGKKISRPELQREFFSNVFTYHGQGLTTVWSRLFKRELIEKWQLRFDERQKYGEDLVFSLKYADKADTLFVSEKPFYQYHISGGAFYRKSDYSYDLIKVHETLLSLNNEYGMFLQDSPQYFHFQKCFFYDTFRYLKNEFVSNSQKKVFLKSNAVRTTVRYLTHNKKMLSRNERIALFFFTPWLYQLALKWL